MTDSKTIGASQFYHIGEQEHTNNHTSQSDDNENPFSGKTLLEESKKAENETKNP